MHLDEDTVSVSRTYHIRGRLGAIIGLLWRAGSTGLPSVSPGPRSVAATALSQPSAKRGGQMATPVPWQRWKVRACQVGTVSATMTIGNKRNFVGPAFNGLWVGLRPGRATKVTFLFTLFFFFTFITHFKKWMCETKSLVNFFHCCGHSCAQKRSFIRPRELNCDSSMLKERSDNLKSRIKKFKLYLTESTFFTTVKQ